MILQSQTTGDRSRFVVVVVIIFILGWLQTVVGGVGVYVVWCFYVLSNHTSHDKVQKIEIGREKAFFSEVQSTLPFVQGND